MSGPPPESEAELWVERGSRRYLPGETLRGGYSLSSWRDAGLTVVELSVLWHTAGQGEEDFYVHHFERFRSAQLPALTGEAPYTFETVLPLSPHSYDGQIVRVCWVARLRGHFRGGRRRVVEAPFALGPPSPKAKPYATSPSEGDDG
ncbi:MAG: hypothetical protein AAF805_12015 [Planctomycetota bacterium]